VEPLQDAIEKPAGFPLPKAMINGLPRSVSFGEIAPGGSRTEDPEDTDEPIASTRTSHRLLRKQILDQCSLIVEVHGII